MTGRWSLIAGVAAVALFPAGAQARKSNDEQMLSLDPTTRIEQRCDARGMGIVQREHPPMRPDELVAYAYAAPRIKGSTITAPGAAVRSGGVWYHLSYSCTTTSDGLGVISFSYRLGAAIPRSEWAAHYLVAP